MQQHEWERVKEVFTAALDQPLAQRAQFVAASCGDDGSLRGEVESLLAAHEEPKNLLEQHTIDLAAQLQTNGPTYYGEQFGAYRILREIGRGGMGAVFLAERADGEFQQQVALKIIRHSFADFELDKHFRRERQILASLNHANIAKLFDGGVSEKGEPFLAMEYVEGHPLLRFAEERNLSVNDRLRLFLKVCAAVAFAHSNLIIHRDLKPSNILVTENGDPKLLDFGLAKILNEARTDQNQTTTAFRAFTPSYASPEQIRGKNVTTTTDVYSLGIVLYELLTSERPFKTEDKSFEEIIKEITAREPTKPSEVISETYSDDPSALRNQRLLKGDLDNIVLMALRKEPERRYSSVEQFAQDIERHLEHQPIAARPNTFGYRAGKFFQRNRISVSAAALILIVLLGGIAVSFWQYRKAQNEKAKAQEVNAFLKKMLLTASPANPSDKKGYSTTIDDVLNEATKRLESEDLANQPEVKAELQQIIGSCYLEQGRYDLGERYLREALATRTKLFGAHSPQLLETQLALASLYFAKANYDEAERLYAENLQLARAEYRKGNLDASLMFAALNSYALLRRARGDSKQAEQLLRENLDIRSESATAAEDRNATQILLALTQLDQGKFDEAEGFVRKQVDDLRQDPNHETVAFGNALTLLGSVLMEKGQIDEAQTDLRAAEQIYRKLFSPNSIAIYDNLRLQAQVAYLENDLIQAAKLIDRVLDNYRHNSNPKYINFATALTVQGLILNKVGKGDAAETALRDALKLRIENLPPKHFMTALTKGALGEVLTSRKQYAEAETLLRESYQDLQFSQAADNQRLAVARNRISALNAINH